MALNAYTAMQTELGGEPGEEHAEALQLAYAAQTTLANVKGGKSKGSGKAGGKKGGKVPPSNLSIADRKAKLAELLAMRAECRFKRVVPVRVAPVQRRAPHPGNPELRLLSQAYLAALSDTSDDEVPAIHLSNTVEDMEGYRSRCALVLAGQMPLSCVTVRRQDLTLCSLSAIARV